MSFTNSLLRKSMLRTPRGRSEDGRGTGVRTAGGHCPYTWPSSLAGASQRPSDSGAGAPTCLRRQAERQPERQALGAAAETSSRLLPVGCPVCAAQQHTHQAASAPANYSEQVNEHDPRNCNNAAAAVTLAPLRRPPAPRASDLSEQAASTPCAPEPPTGALTDTKGLNEILMKCTQAKAGTMRAHRR